VVVALEEVVLHPWQAQVVVALEEVVLHPWLVQVVVEPVEVEIPYLALEVMAA
jgi:hypothetical protein